MGRAIQGQNRGAGDRLPQESDVAWQAFVAYRDMPPDKRSQRDVAKQLGRHPSQIADWSSKHGWVRRAADWDEAADRIFRQEMQRERRSMARRHAKIAGAVLAKAVERLQTLDAAKLTAGQLAQLLDVATRVERRALGEPDRVEHSGPDGGPIQVEQIRSDDEIDLIAELNVLAQVMQERLGETAVDQSCPLCGKSNERRLKPA